MIQQHPLKILRKDGIKVGRVRIDKDGVTIEPACDDAAAVEADADEAERESISRIIREM